MMLTPQGFPPQPPYGSSSGWPTATDSFVTSQPFGTSPVPSYGAPHGVGAPPTFTSSQTFSTAQTYGAPTTFAPSQTSSFGGSVAPFNIPDPYGAPQSYGPPSFGTTQPFGASDPYGGYGTPSSYGAPQSYGPPQPHGPPPPPPAHPGAPPPPPPQQYGGAPHPPPPQQYGGAAHPPPPPPQQYGGAPHPQGPPQNFGHPQGPQGHGTPTAASHGASVERRMCNHTRGAERCTNEAVPGYAYCYAHSCPGCMGAKPSDAPTCAACVGFGQHGTAPASPSAHAQGHPPPIPGNPAERCARSGPNGQCLETRNPPSMFCGAHTCPICGREKTSKEHACQAHQTMYVTPQTCRFHDWAEVSMGAMMKKCQFCDKTIMDMKGMKCRHCGAGSHRKCMGLQ